MERRGSEKIHPHVVPRQVIASWQPGLVEFHGPVGGGEQQIAQPDFQLTTGWDDADRVAWRHGWFNGSADTSIPCVGVPVARALAVTD
jgi:hypothetical protein